MLYPLFIMVILTFVILLFTLRVRISSVQKGEVPLGYYSLFQCKELQGEALPDLIAKTNRHFANLFEVPVLFYAGGILYVALDATDPFPVYCAWSFVGARLIHTIIHLGYNKVMHRLVAFGLGNLSALAMWISIVSSAT